MPEIFPKISIITPSYNQGQFIEETILSILNQGYPNLEYIIIDGGSNDNTLDIIRKYERRISYWVSEKDAGLYYALNKGFQKASGEILGWLNSDDILHKNALKTIASVLLDLPDIEWLGGVPNHIDELGRSVWVGNRPKWNKYRYLSFDFKYIQQEGIFWKKNLWIKSGGYISTEYALASDLELWSRFFNYAHLYTLPSILASFRVRSANQKSMERLDDYNEEAMRILQNMKCSKIESRNLKIKNSFIYRFLKTFNFWRIFYQLGYGKAEKAIDKTPPNIYFDRNIQKFVREE